MKRDHRGFTLIEILVVVAIIGILLMVAVPSFASFISNYRATSGVNEFLQGTILTRNEALKRGRRVVMVPNDASGNPTPNGRWANGWTIFVDVSSPASLTYTAPPPPPAVGDQLIYRHPALPTSSVTVDGVIGSGEAFSQDGKTYIAYDGTGYPRWLTGATQTGGIMLTDTLGSAISRRALCMTSLGRPRIVQNNVTATSCAGG